MVAKILSKHESHNCFREKIYTTIPAEVRFGCVDESEVDIGQIIINEPEAIRRVSNKYTMKTIFKENRIPSSEFFLLEDMPENVKFPIIAKKRFHSKGRGMVKINSQEELDEFLSKNRTNYYYEIFNNYLREYRVHSSRLTPCFYALRKMLKRDTPEDQRWYRNDSNSVWILESNPSFNRPNTWDQIIDTCHRATLALGMDTCCYDVLVARDGRFLILEGNSAPSMGEATPALYINEIQKLIQYKYENRTN